MNLTRRVDTDLTYDEAVARVTDALQDQGFGVLTRIDVRQTLSDKLGVETGPQVILGACNPQLAHQALEIDPRVATLLPCNVVVRTESTGTVVEALDPELVADVAGRDDLRPIAREAATRISAALDVLRWTTARRPGALRARRLAASA